MSLTTAPPTRAARVVPSARTAAALVLGAAVGLIAWEIFARAVAPAWIGGPLQPTGLVKSLFANFLGLPVGQGAAQGLHVATGLVFYPAAFWLLTRMHSFGWAVDGLLWGIATWFLALGVFAPLGGLPFLLGIGQITWAALVGHVIYGLGAAGGFAALHRRLA